MEFSLEVESPTVFWLASSGAQVFHLEEMLLREEGGKRVDTPVLAALRSLLARGGLIGATR